MQGVKAELENSSINAFDLSNNQEIARLPDEVQRASRAGRLIVFLGAGLSCAAGLPSWDKVKNDLIANVRLRPGEDEGLKLQLQRMEDHYFCFEAIYRQDKTTYESIVDKSLRSDRANLGLFNQLLDDVRFLKPVSLVTTNQ